MKTSLLIFLLSAITFNLLAQVNNQRGPNFALGIQATRSLSQSQTGVSGNISALWHAADKSADKWMASIKASHLSGSGNKFFSAFDDGETANLSTLSLMGGYRVGINFHDDVNKPYEPYNSQLFVDGQAGVAFVGTEKISPTAVLGVGYNITRHFEINASGQWMNGRNKSIWLVGLGGAYTF